MEATTSCTACRSPDTIQDDERGEICCTRCGMVLEDRIPGADAEPAGEALHAPAAGRSTVMAGGSRSAGGSAARMRRCDQWIASSAAASPLRGGALGRLRAMHDKLGLPEGVYRGAEAAYRRTTAVRNCRGRRLLAVMAASLYLACREADAPRTLGDVGRASGLPAGTVAKYVRFVLKRRGAVPPGQYSLPVLITRAANAVGASLACRRAAVETAGSLGMDYLAGKNPQVMAAAALYAAGRRASEKHSAADIASVFGISPASVRMRASEMA